MTGHTRVRAERSQGGRVLEAPTSSLFWVKDGEALTPPLSDHILASITRRVVIDVSGARERECRVACDCESDPYVHLLAPLVAARAGPQARMAG